MGAKIKIFRETSKNLQVRLLLYIEHESNPGLVEVECRHILIAFINGIRVEA